MDRELRDVRFSEQAGDGVPIRIVAAVNKLPNGEIFDWAAYIGRGSAEEVARHGDKLFGDWAYTFFPDLPTDLYRA